MADVSRLSINHATLLEQCSMPQFVEVLARNNVKGASLWREKVREYGVKESAKLIRDNGIALSGYCWAGMIASPDKAEADKALDDVRRAFDEAAEVGRRALCSSPAGRPARQEYRGRRAQRVLDRIADLIPLCARTSASRSRSSRCIR